MLMIVVLKFINTIYFYLHPSKARKKLFSHVETIISINKK